MFDLGGLSVKSKGAWVAFKTPCPSLLSDIPTTKAPASQRPVSTSAARFAGSPDTESTSSGADAFAACVRSTQRRTMQVRLPTVPRRGGRFTD